MTCPREEVAELKTIPDSLTPTSLDMYFEISRRERELHGDQPTFVGGSQLLCCLVDY